MKCIWLGQAGLLLEIKGLTIMIDPYLSNSVEAVDPGSFRRIPIDESFFAVKPDVMIFTHDHLDHYDPETVKRYITCQSSILVLAPGSVWADVRRIGGKNNYVLFNRHTEWTERGVRFIAVRSEHSDDHAIGVIIDDGEKKYYITGDTLYNEDIFADVPDGIYALFLPVNGVGNNMNMADAVRFAKKVKAEKVIPVHIGMFDSISAEDLDVENRVTLSVYSSTEI